MARLGEEWSCPGCQRHTSSALAAAARGAETGGGSPASPVPVPLPAPGPVRDGTVEAAAALGAEAERPTASPAPQAVPDPERGGAMRRAAAGPTPALTQGTPRTQRTPRVVRTPRASRAQRVPSTPSTPRTSDSTESTEDTEYTEEHRGQEQEQGRQMQTNTQGGKRQRSSSGNADGVRSKQVELEKFLHDHKPGDRGPAGDQAEVPRTGSRCEATTPSEQTGDAAVEQTPRPAAGSLSW